MFCREQQESSTESYKLWISNTIAISLIDSLPREVVCLTLRNLTVEYNEFVDQYDGPYSEPKSHNPEEQKKEELKNSELRSPEFRKDSPDRRRKKEEQKKDEDNKLIRKMISLSLDSFVINNQLPDTQFPVVLAPNKKRKSHEEVTPFLSVNLYINSDSKKDSSLYYITNFNVFLDTLEMRIDDQLIEALIMIFQQVILSTNELGKRNDDGHQTLLEFQRTLEERMDKKLELPQTNKRIYMKQLNLEPIEIIITFRNSPGYKMNIMATSFLTDFGLVLASVDSAKIKLNSLKCGHIFGSVDDITKKITKHYSRQFWNQLYKILGSIELLGNPVSLISNLGTGVSDLFYEPLHSLATGKATKHGHKFGKALAYGAASLISHSVKGIWGTLNNITRSIVKAIASLTRDKDWLRKRQNMKNRTVKTIKEGFTHGGKFLLITLWGAVWGIVERPYVEVKHGGFIGFFKGLYQVIKFFILCI